MSGLSLEMTNVGGKKLGDRHSPLTSTPTNNWKSESIRTSQQQTTSWLNMSMDAALGCRASIFQIQRSSTTGKKTSGISTGTSVHIHPQAAPLVCRHAIDLLISLAKTFPSHFLPTIEKESTEEKSSNTTNKTTSVSVSGTNTTTVSTATTTTVGGATTTTPTTEKTSSSGTTSSISKQPASVSSGVEPSEFWDLLVKLDSINVSRKGKGLPRIHLNSNGNNDPESKVTTLEKSPLGLLIQQLAHPVIKRSSLLTDRLLRLLALVSLRHPDTTDVPSKSDQNSSLENAKALEHLLSLSIEVSLLGNNK